MEDTTWGEGGDVVATSKQAIGRTGLEVTGIDREQLGKWNGTGKRTPVVRPWF